jgi:hypothetical protein
MSRAETFSAIRKGITDYGDKGNEVVAVDKLLQYLDALESEMGDADEISISQEEALERLRAKFANQQLEYGWKKDFALAEYGWKKDWGLEMFKSTIAAGQNSMRAAMLMHGGAAIALLAFIGNLAVNPDTLPLVKSFGGILPWYLGGLLLVVIAYGTTYLTQSHFSEDKKEHLGKRWNITSCVLVILSYLAFIAGSWLGYLALMGMTTGEVSEPAAVSNVSTSGPSVSSSGPSVSSSAANVSTTGDSPN